MDPYASLMEFTRKLERERIIVPTGVVNGRLKVDKPEEDVVMKEPVETGTDYVNYYVQCEEAKYEHSTSEKLKTGTLSCIDSLPGVEVRNEEPAAIAFKSGYFYTESTRQSNLPIETIRDDLLKTLQTSQVVVIRGHTGCGKTTQIPQFILDDCKARNEYCNIVVTQPRKIAAISVAKRVCEERTWKIGSVCGHQVGLSKEVSQHTLITYATTGVLLQKLIRNKNLNEFTHIILDEIHERSQETDFLMLIIRKFLYFNSPHVKIILMSATLDTEKFAYYFRTQRSGLKYLAPTLCVSKKHGNYHTSIHYINELREISKIPEFNIAEPMVHAELFTTLLKLVEIFDTLDSDSIGHVLVFLPGMYEIETAFTVLDESRQSRNHQNKIQWAILPLHSSISSYEQAKVFQQSKYNERKIILSTNIAESSITVPDVVYVIDFCLTKSMSVNRDTQYQSLQIQWASHVNCVQRAGRVGRVQPGRVYRLVPEDFYRHEMLKDTVPEMLQAPLDRIVLCAKRLELDEPPKAILALCLDPPQLENVDATILNLKEAGAMLPTCKGELMKSDGDITFLGIIMASLPLDVKLSKLICLGYIFSCLEECIIIAAGCSLQNLFSTPFKERLSAYTNKLIWADNSFSDLTAHYSLYKVWDKNVFQTELSVERERKRWCQQNHLSFRSMNEWSFLVTEINKRLENMGIDMPTGPERVDMDNTELSLMLKVVICGAFYPNYFTRSGDGGCANEQESFKMLKGLNPLQTVYFKNMDIGQPGPLYVQRIKEIMEPVSKDIKVSFDSTSSVYITFMDSLDPLSTEIKGRKFLTARPGKISLNVYKAIRMRQLKMRTSFPALNLNDAWELAKKCGLSRSSTGACVALTQEQQRKDESVLPALHVEYLEIAITHVIDAGHFFAQPADEKCSKVLETIYTALNIHATQLNVLPENKVVVGEICAAQFADDGHYYRCKIMGLNPLSRNEIRAQIIFIDYGNTVIVEPKSLYEIHNDEICALAPQAMECVLRGIQPIVCLNPHQIWPQNVNDFFEKAIPKKGTCVAKVYSMVDDIVSIDLYRAGSKQSMNDLLVAKGFAEPREESYNSRENNMTRQQFRKAKILADDSILIGAIPKSADVSIEAPRRDVCNTRIELKGPYSPLEMKVFSIFKSQHPAQIDSSSVNTVLLDADPQDPHARLLVAACVSQKPQALHYTLRHTTLMPNIHGFTAIMALIFAPKILTKVDDYGTRYVSLLCGLGSDSPANASIYPAHDINIVLDTELTKRDVELANEIRYCMNKIVEDMEAKYNKQERRANSYHRDLKDRVIKLLQIPKKSQAKRFVKHASSWTKTNFDGKILVAGKSKLRNEVWSLHNIVELMSEENASLKDHLEELRDLACCAKEWEGIAICQFCHYTSHSLDNLRVHLISKDHKSRIQKTSF